MEGREENTAKSMNAQRDSSRTTRRFALSNMTKLKKKKRERRKKEDSNRVPMRVLMKTPILSFFFFLSSSFLPETGFFQVFQRPVLPAIAHVRRTHFSKQSCVVVVVVPFLFFFLVWSLLFKLSLSFYVLYSFVCAHFVLTGSPLLNVCFRFSR